jgi:hypothetical protein
MNARLTALLQEYWLLTAEFASAARGEVGDRKTARLKLVEDEIRAITDVENRCTFCLSDLDDSPDTEAEDGGCCLCIPDWLH